MFVFVPNFLYLYFQVQKTKISKILYNNYCKINKVGEKMSLRSKMTVSFILIIFLTISPLFFILQTRVKPISMKNLEYQTLQLVDSKGKEIGSWLNQRISEMRIIHENPFTKELNLRELKPYITKLNMILGSQYGNSDETFAIGGVNGLGWVNDHVTIDVSDREYFKKAISSEMEYVISDPVISKSDNKEIFLICYPIINNENKKVGFINGSINLENFSRITKDIDIYGGLTWIMNKNKKVYSMGIGEMKEKYVSLDGLDKIVADFSKNPLGTTSLNNIHGKDVTVFFSSIPYTEDWILCTMVENDNIHSQTNSIINYVIFMGLVLVFIAIFLAIIISRSIGKPLEALKYNMLEVSRGNLNSYYKLGNNDDEISVLGTVFNEMVVKIDSLIQEVLHVQSQKRDAELRALQSQINPHFLYNTLDTLQWKAIEYKAFEVADMVNALSRFFRISLSSGKEFITISDEIDHVKNYLEIQKMRYRDKINYNINVDPSVGEIFVPKILLQPLVENSIYHGLKPRKHLGTILIEIFSKEGYIYIEVIDNGLGIDDGQLQLIRKNLAKSIESKHYGLYNINERLKLTFGDKYNVTIESDLGIGTKVLLKIPIMDGGFQCLE